MAHFKFMPTVLHHLGKGLYRNMETVIAEAISNSWDANAKNIYIQYDSLEYLEIWDDGDGMDDIDFQNKFLSIGYQRRNEKIKSKRQPIGRKGIGKLALLSVSNILTIYSKKSGQEKYSGGIIDNTKIDELANQNPSDPQASERYDLDPIDQNDAEKTFSKLLPNKTSGTILKFSNLNTQFRKKETLIARLELAFDTTLIKDNDKFNVHVDGHPLKFNALKSVIENTQYIWTFDDSYKEILPNIDEKNVIRIDDPNFLVEGKSYTLKGFIASVTKPSQRKIKIGELENNINVSVYANNRLRVSDILSKVSKNRISENYLWGRIHADFFEDDATDHFTSNREDITDSPLRDAFIKYLDNKLSVIIKKWDELRKAERTNAEKELEHTDGVKLSPIGKKMIADIRDAVDNNIDDIKKLGKQVNQTVRKAISEEDEPKGIFISYKSSNKIHNNEQDIISWQVATSFKKLFTVSGIPEKYIFFQHHEHEGTSIPANEHEADFILNAITGDWHKNWHKVNSGIGNKFIEHEVIFITIASSIYYKNWWTSIEFGAAWGSSLDQKKIKHVSVIFDSDENYSPKVPANPSGISPVVATMQTTNKPTIRQEDVSKIRSWTQEAIALTGAQPKAGKIIDGYIDTHFKVK